MSRNLFYSSILIILFSSSDLLGAADEYYSQTVWGGVGLIQNPTARFSPDGEFGFGISNESPMHRVYTKAQVFPWAEVVIKYTEETYQPYTRAARSKVWTYKGTQTDRDKGMDVKLHLLKETENRPSLAFGMLDIGGTGQYGSEYLVASKKLNNFDFSLGIGWGRLGGKSHLNNPFGWFAEGHKKRNRESGMGGYINPARWFTGEHASFFGGIEYQTPIKNLSLKMEYDSSDYTTEIGREKVFYETGDIFEIDSPINLALNYRYEFTFRDKVDLSLGLIRGNTLYANFMAHTNIERRPIPKYEAPPETLNVPYLRAFDNLNDEWKKYLPNLIMWQMGNEGLVPHNIFFGEDEMIVEISQGRFQRPIQAIDLASRILANNSPVNIKKITVINLDLGVETLRATIDRDRLVQIVKNGPLSEEDVLFNQYYDYDNDSYSKVENDYLYPNFFWSLRPNMNGTLQHQEKFYFWQLEALLHTEYSIRKGLYLTTDIGIDIDNNFEDYTYHVPDGQLHHVRQNRRLYLTEGKSGMRKMALDYYFDIDTNLYGKLSGGYLEWMYGGFGGELLYLPENSHWGIGLDAYWVKQRDFDQKFSFQEFETTTGFLSFYYEIPFYDIRLKASAGKFLGTDKGVQIDISRRFDSGARLGAIVSLTNCDSRCVGEGSFNKWVYFTLPMDPFYISSTTRQETGFAWAPLTKDAGTRVDPSGALFEIATNARDEVDEIRRTNWSIKKIFSGFHTGRKFGS